MENNSIEPVIEKFNKFRERYGGIIQILAILLILLLIIVAALNLTAITNHPCEICMEQGYNCFKGVLES